MIRYKLDFLVRTGDSLTPVWVMPGNIFPTQTEQVVSQKIKDLRMSVFKLLAGFTLSASSMLAATSAMAAPAPVFEPVLDEIQPSPPFRIPATVPADRELYPSVTSGTGGSMIFLSTEPSCDDISCTALVVATESEPPPLWPFIGANPMQSIALADGVQAHFWELRGMASLQWIQDDAFYVLTYSQDIFSQEDAIAMATSMATEPPFTP